MSPSPSNEELAGKHAVDVAVIERLRSELGYTADSVDALSQADLRRVLLKAEYPGRAARRLEHAQASRSTQDGPPEPLEHPAAVAEMARLGGAESTGLVAGVPSGSGQSIVEDFGPVAGLDAAGTGWSSVGRGRIGGRTRAIAVDPEDPDVILLGSAGGGVWRSTNGGVSWKPTQDMMGTLAVSSLVRDPTQRGVIYAGTGEGFDNIGAALGNGIYRSDDDGSSWTSVEATAGRSGFRHVNSLGISRDGDVLIAGTSVGIYRSTEAARDDWQRVIGAPIGNLQIDPTDDSRWIAGTRRGQTAFSRDGGRTWRAATPPGAGGRRVQVCFAAADPSIAYASVDVRGSELWRSADGGRTWSARPGLIVGSSTATASWLSGQGWYANALWAGDPTDPDLVVVGGLDLWRSTDGGETFRPISTWQSSRSVHADHHAIVATSGYDGSGNRGVFFGNDGGIYLAADVRTAGSEWSPPFKQGWSSKNRGYEATQF